MKVNRGGAEKEGQRKITSRLCAVSTEPDVGLERRNPNIMT